MCLLAGGEGSPRGTRGISWRSPGFRGNHTWVQALALHRTSLSVPICIKGTSLLPCLHMKAVPGQRQPVTTASVTGVAGRGQEGGRARGHRASSPAAWGGVAPRASRAQTERKPPTVQTLALLVQVVHSEASQGQGSGDTPLPLPVCSLPWRLGRRKGRGSGGWWLQGNLAWGPGSVLQSRR